MIYDVVIAGAGPVGLFLACELRLAGRSVLVLEQAKDPHSPLKGLPLGLRGLWGPSTEAFYRRGLLNDLAAQSSKGGWGGNPSIGEKGKPRRPAGHFAGILFYADKIDFPNWRYRLQSPAAIPMPSDMEHIEAVLTARASALGVEIRRGLGVEGFEEYDEEVVVHAGTETYQGSWLVGCDGGRSTVRKTAGFEFVGTAPEFTGYSLQLEMADPDKLPLGRHYTPTGVFSQAQPGVVTMVDFDGGASHRTQPLTIDHVQAVLRRISGVDVTLTTLKLATTWTDRAYQTTAYRKGRVLLAGDAAHVHSPLGGQGLNLGFGDAMNLGWKLAATLRGDLPAGLLDTYSSERHPVGARILDWSRAQIALMRPTPASRALEAIVRDLVETRDGATYFAERVWGVSIRYDLGGSHPLTGRSAPDFELVNGTRLGELLQNGRGLLLDFDASPSLQALGARWSDRITYVASDAKDRLDVSALLVRPDGFVAWAAEGSPNHEEAAQAALKWFGEPRG